LRLQLAHIHDVAHAASQVNEVFDEWGSETIKALFNCGTCFVAGGTIFLEIDVLASEIGGFD
jgi:hypothetical protein